MGKKKRSKPSNLSLIRMHGRVKFRLHEKFTDLGLSNRDVINDAAELGYTIHEAAMSKYFRSTRVSSGMLTEKDILFLCVRYGLKIQLDVIDEGMNTEDIATNLRNLFHIDPRLLVKMKRYE